MSTFYVSQLGSDLPIAHREHINAAKMPRHAPRHLFDFAIGDDNVFRSDKYKWSARLEVINFTNEYVLYNFLSIFSGTHYVTPRTATGTIGFHF